MPRSSSRQPVVVTRSLSTLLFCGLALASTTTIQAATVIWNGASGTDTNWSNAANWSGGAPPSNDIKFFNDGSTGVAGTPNNLVDGAYTGSIASLQYGNSNGFHTTVIPAGQALNVTGAGGLSVYTPGDIATGISVIATISGQGTLVVSNSSANILANQGASSGGNPRATLDLSGLDTFNATVNRIGIGTTTLPNSGSANQRDTGTLWLARTNRITVLYSLALNTYLTTASQSGIEMAHNPGNNGGAPSFLYLGQTNAIFVDSIAVGKTKASAAASGQVRFNPSFTNDNPVAYFRGVGGDNSRVTWWAIGDMSTSASSAQVSVGTNDFSGGTVDAKIETMSLGRDCTPSHTAGTPIVGTLIFNSGTIDVNTMYAGNQSIGPNGSSTSCRGFVNLTGPSATLVVNSNLVLGRTTQPSAAAANSYGVLNILEGTVRARSITIGSNNVNNAIVVNGGSLVVSNTVGTDALPLPNLSLTNATLVLHVPSGMSPIVHATNLVTGGTTNVISLPSVAVQSSYPAQIVLINYTGSIGGAGFNFGFGDTSLPLSAPGAYLSNNVANSSVDLVLPFDPRPVFTSVPGSFGGRPGTNTTFDAVIQPESVTPLTFQWYLGATPLSDGPTGNGSTLSGTTTDTLALTNAVEADSGNYTLVASNQFGVATSAPPTTVIISASDVAPEITGLSDKTAIQGDDATFSAIVTGLPYPDLQWLENGTPLDGENGVQLTLNNVQASQNGYIYSLVASNSAGIITNHATLTVIVSPEISVQPSDLTVTNTQEATFSVTASGVPAPAYQWYFNNSPILNATNSTHPIASATPANIGLYKVVITNLAGSVTSTNARLTVTSTMGYTALSPANSASGICYDTPLYITFSQTPFLTNLAKIKIFNVLSNDPVDVIDLTLNSSTGAQGRGNFPGDGQAFNYYPVIITGNTAAIYPHAGVMTSNQTYYVILEPGVVRDASGAYFAGISDTNAWKFSTKPTGAANPTNIVVNMDGSGDFVTVQGAVDSIPLGNTTPTVINIRNGDYVEIVNISGKHNVTFRGQHRTATLVGYANNANLAPGGTTHARMAFKINANDIALENLTVTNRTPQGGSQAEAIMISTAARTIVNNADVFSRQDTILGNTRSSQAYFHNSTIAGNFDYIWGGGNLYFDQCNIRTIPGSGGPNVTAARTETSGTMSATHPWVNPNGTTYSANGFSFVECSFTADAGAGSPTLAGNNGTAGGVSSWAFCKFDAAHVTPTLALSNNYVFWQHGNSNIAGTSPVSFANVQSIGGSPDDPRLLAATNITTWFYGWTPQLAPNILTNPVGATVDAGDPVTLSVVATGIPDPTYQWLKNSTNLDGETGSTLNIASAQVSDAGDYSVIVTTPAGSATSATATVNVNPPVYNPPTISTIGIVGGQFSITFDGDPGALYGVSTSTNLVLWTTIFTTNAPALPFIWYDTNAPDPARFYRVFID